MSVSTENTRAIQGATDLLGFVQQLEDLKVAAVSLSGRITQGNYETLWGKMATYTPAADGTQPASNDASPVATNPIAGINVSSNNLNLFANMCNDFITFMTNGTTAPPASNREAPIQAATE